MHTRCQNQFSMSTCLHWAAGWFCFSLKFSASAGQLSRRLHQLHLNFSRTLAYDLWESIFLYFHAFAHFQADFIESFRFQTLLNDQTLNSVFPWCTKFSWQIWRQFWRQFDQCLFTKVEIFLTIQMCARARWSPYACITYFLQFFVANHFATIVSWIFLFLPFISSPHLQKMFVHSGVGKYPSSLGD